MPHGEGRAVSQAATLDAPGPAGTSPRLRQLPRKRYNKWLVTLSISFGTLMGAIDMSIVNVALPHIRGSVSATVQEITWISTGYAVANVIVMPLTAFLARMFGQKRVYVSCLVLFLVGSILCGLATSLPALVFFRALQGSAPAPCNPPSKRSCARPSRRKSRAWPWRCSAWP